MPFTINVVEICEQLQSAERDDRQKSLRELQEFFDHPENVTATASIIQTYEACFLHVLKCYADKFENIRELANHVITAAIDKLPINDYYLQYIISTLESRIGKKETIENSEEIRLEHLKQLNFLIIKYGSGREVADSSLDCLLKCLNEIIAILIKTLSDNYPTIQREACRCIRSLGKSTPSFHYGAHLLVKPIFPMLHHKHSHNRIDAVQTLGNICMYITSKSDLIIQIITEISPLLMDPMPLVRLQCGKVGCFWLLHLMDRYSFFERILPLVLCCLKDDAPEVRNTIEKDWIKCGVLYYEENETELNTLELVDEKSPNYPEGVQRPTLGCRALVQRSLRMVTLIMRETSDWKDEVRLHALKLMYQFVLHAEQKLTAKFFEVYPDLAKACADPVKEISNEALKVADLLGRLLNYEDWINHGIENLEKHAKLGYIKCFFSIYSPTTINRSDDILRISRIITHSDYSSNLRAEFQEFLLKLCDLLWQRAEILKKVESAEMAMSNLNLNEQLGNVEKNLYHVIMKVISLAFEDSNSIVYVLGKTVLLKLTNCIERDTEILHRKYLSYTLESFDNLDAENNEYAEPILLLHGVIRIAGFKHEYLNELKRCIQNVWSNGLPDACVKIFSAISIAMLNWSEEIGLNEYDSQIALKSFIEDIVVPHLTWKAGASAETLRSLATATLCSMTQGAKLEAPHILPGFAHYFPGLIEDNNAKTRCFALRCFYNFGSVDVEHLKPIGYAILQRLDDPCSEIREWAARIFCKINPTELKEGEADIWKTLIEHAFTMLFIHYDGPEVKLRDCVKESLIVLGRKYPQIFKTKYYEVMEISNNKDEIEEIKTLVFKTERTS